MQPSLLVHCTVSISGLLGYFVSKQKTRQKQMPSIIRLDDESIRQNSLRVKANVNV